MRTLISVGFVTMAMLLSAAAQENSTARPNIIHRELVAGMPRGDRQEVHVITASFKPGDKTVFHTHTDFRSPSMCWRAPSRLNWRAVPP